MGQVWREAALRLQLVPGVYWGQGGAGTCKAAFFDPFFVRSYKAFFNLSGFIGFVAVGERKGLQKLVCRAWWGSRA